MATRKTRQYELTDILIALLTNRLRKEVNRLDVTLVQEDFRDRLLGIAGGHGHGVVPGHLSVADAGEHIGDGIVNYHFLSPPFAYQLALRTPGICPL